MSKYPFNPLGTEGTLAGLTHQHLILLAIKTLRHRYELIGVEFEPYKQRIAFDFIALSRHNKEIRIIECKANRANFLADMKWRRYLPYATHLAFLGTKEVFRKEELPNKVGIIRPRLRLLRSGDRQLEWYYERGCRRLRDELEPHDYLAIIEGFLGYYSRCLWRCPDKRLLKGVLG